MVSATGRKINHHDDIADLLMAPQKHAQFQTIQLIILLMV